MVVIADCWEWQGASNRSGHGHFNIDGKTYYAHRLAWTWLVGPIPDGLTLDHLCRNPPCVNPDHLEPVTHRENSKRGFSPAAIGARRDECPQGHLYDDANTYAPPGSTSRVCRTCGRLRARERRMARKEWSAA